MSPEARANLGAVLQNLSVQLRVDIALARNLTPAAVDAAMAQALHDGDAAVAGPPDRPCRLFRPDDRRR